MGSGKSGGANQSKDYYGTVMGVIGVGPMTSIQGILLNGNQVFGVGWIDPDFGTPGSALVYNPGGGVGEGYSLSVKGLGTLIIHWGLETATSDSVLSTYANHPPYKGYAYVVLDNCLFGTEQQTAPNLEFICTFAPNQSIVTGTSAALDSNNNANCVAIAAEVATAWWGLALPATSLNQTSFQTVADSIRTDAFFSQGLANVSPIWKDQTDARTMFGDLQGTCDLWFGFDTAGLFYCGQWFRGGPSGSVTAITANQWVTPPEDAPDDITSVPTAFDVGFFDKTQLFQRTSAPTNNLMAIRLNAIGKRQSLKREMLLTSAQAHLMGGEAIRLLGNPTPAGQVGVRPSQAVNPDGTPIRPGSYFELDTQSEPGGTGILELVRCTGRSFDPESEITLEYEFDPGAVPTAYQVPYSNATPSTEVIPPVGNVRIISLPPQPGYPPNVFVLTVRLQPKWIGVQIWEDSVSSGDYTLIGLQPGFAYPVELTSAIASTDTTINLQAISGYPTYDQSYLTNAVGVDSDSASRNNALLCILVRKNPSTGTPYMNGTVPWIEICSVVETTVTGTGKWAVQVLRGRMGTSPLAFDGAGLYTFPDAFYAYEAWVIPSALLEPMSHSDFPAAAAVGGTVYFQLAAYTAKLVYSPAAAYAASLQSTSAWTPTYPYAFPIGYTQAPVITITAPTAPATTNTSGQITLTFTVSDPTNSMAKIDVFSVLSVDGSQNTSYLSQNLLNDGSFSYSQTITLPAVEGMHTLTIRVTNAYNVTGSQTIQIYRAVSSSGYGLSAPTVSPTSQSISGSAVITITAPSGSSGTSQIQYNLNGGSWVSGTAGVHTLTVTIVANTLLTVRMTDTGPIYSAVVANFYPNAIANGGTLYGSQTLS